MWNHCRLHVWRAVWQSEYPVKSRSVNVQTFHSLKKKKKERTSYFSKSYWIKGAFLTCRNILNLKGKKSTKKNSNNFLFNDTVNSLLIKSQIVFKNLSRVYAWASILGIVVTTYSYVKSIQILLLKFGMQVDGTWAKE